MAFGAVRSCLNGIYNMDTYLGTRIDTFHVGDKIQMVAIGPGANDDYDGCVVLVKAVRGQSISAKILHGYKSGSELDWTIDNTTWSAVTALDWDE